MTNIIPDGLVERPFGLPSVKACEFLSRVDIRGREECWPWKGSSLQKDGRGVFSVGGANIVAPRVMLALCTGGMPSSRVFACHSCDNPNCVNPAHLWWGSARDNAIDASHKGRFYNQTKDSCPHGHPFEGENLRVGKCGKRICRTCQRLNHQAYKKRARAARATLSKSTQVRALLPDEEKPGSGEVRT